MPSRASGDGIERGNSSSSATTPPNRCDLCGREDDLAAAWFDDRPDGYRAGLICRDRAACLLRVVRLGKAA